MPEPPAKSSAPSRRFLVRGVNWLGDAVMTTPALGRLREAHPNAHISLLTAAKLGDLWRHHPAVNEVLTLAPEEGVWSVAQRLRGKGFQTALLFPNSPRSALEIWLARIPVRVGYARPWRNWLLTEAVPTRAGHGVMRKRSVSEIKGLVAQSSADSAEAREETARAPEIAHQMHEYLHLVATQGANPSPLPPQVFVTAEELRETEASWSQRLRSQHSPAGTGGPVSFLGLNPAAAYGPAKRWPAGNFAAVAREVSKRVPGSVWLVFGSKDDGSLGDEIARAAGVNVVNLAGKTSLRELMSLLKLCRVVLTNDSGPMHVAAALGTPVVVPFGSTSPALTGPGLPGDPRHRLLTVPVPCAPCYRRDCPIDLRCLTGITVQRVIEAVMETLIVESLDR